MICLQTDERRSEGRLSLLTDVPVALENQLHGVRVGVAIPIEGGKFKIVDRFLGNVIFKVRARSDNRGTCDGCSWASASAEQA